MTTRVRHPPFARFYERVSRRAAANSRRRSTQPSERKDDHMRLCINWKVVGTLAAGAGGVYLVAPGLFGVALPVLALLACPLSMLVMMRAAAPGASCRPAGDPEAEAAEIARLRGEVAELRNGRSPVKEA